MSDKEIYKEHGLQSNNNEDDTTIEPTTNSSGKPQQGKVNELDNNTKSANTKLENEPDSGDLNDDD
ncbi:MAG: hypothetical protein JO072_14630 [Parafilimonas sp.]|nr:hypothetical protein [Parafilimonas sp.]